MDAVSLGLLVASALITGALGYTIGRAVGGKEGFDKGYAKRKEEVTAQIAPYSHPDRGWIEVGYTLDLLVQGKPVVRPIDTILTEVELPKPTKEDLAHHAALALGYATTVADKMKAAGLPAKVVEPKKARAG